MTKSMVSNAKKYIGKWVAMPSFNRRNVVASGIDPEAVIGRVKAKGYDSPVVVYVPRGRLIHISCELEYVPRR